MIKNARLNNTGFICLTPHFHPGYYPYTSEQRLNVFNKIKESVNDVEIFFGNELHYSPQMLEWLKGKCKKGDL